MAAHRAGRSAEEGLIARALSGALEIDGLRVSIVGGVPHIDGTVSCYGDKRLAAERARALTGCRRIVNRLRVAPQGSSSDVAITEAVLAALRARPHLAAAGIEVRTREGVVELRGLVETSTVRRSVESAACSVRGVDYVVNRLQTQERAATGQELERGLEQDLCRCLGLSPEALHVRFQASVAHLSGIVPSARHRQAAEEMVRWHVQVRDVVTAIAIAQASLFVEESNIIEPEAHAS